MCARVGKFRFGKAFGALGLLSALVALVVAFRPAGAQGDNVPAVQHPPDPCGPIQLQMGDHAIIGVLLPAVQKVREAAMLVILDSSGVPIARTFLPAVQNQPFTPAFVDVYMGDGSVRILKRGGDPASENGTLFQGSSDGALTAVLLPAVQRNRKPVYPTSATIQVMDGAGKTRFALPFFPPTPIVPEDPIHQQ
ncbi:MAG: hypothetical protein ACP5VE_11110 [Chthonomonadales bacterium]